MKRKHLLTLTKKDFRVDTFTAGGKGGQHQNKVETGVRITHLASGIVSEARDSRSQHQNKKNAFTRLAAKPEFKNWLRVESLHKQELERKVKEMMNPKNLLIEVQDGNDWISS